MWAAGAARPPAFCLPGAEPRRPLSCGSEPNRGRRHFRAEVEGPERVRTSVFSSFMNSVTSSNSR